jgi:hypothetical protein
MFKDAPFVQHIATEIKGSVSEEENTMTITTIYLNKINEIDHKFICPLKFVTLNANDICSRYKHMKLF